MVPALAGQMLHRLADGVRRAAKPVALLGIRLLRDQQLDGSGRKGVEFVGIADVAIEALGLVLSDHEDTAEIGMDAVAHGNIHQAVARADRHGRLRAILRQREQPCAPAAPEHDGDRVLHR